MKKYFLISILVLLILATTIRAQAPFQNPIKIGQIEIQLPKQVREVFNHITTRQSEAWLSKNKYQFAELVISGFRPEKTVYVKYYENEENIFKIYKSVNNEWIELGLPGKPIKQSVEFCVDGTLYPITDNPEAFCEKINNEIVQAWYPIHLQTTPALCGEQQYDAFYLGIATPGKYKLVYEYWTSSVCRGVPITLENEFMVV